VDAFPYISVALSFVIGLAVTYLLSSLLAVFRARRNLRLDWLPFAWAAIVLLYQFQYWWAIIELRNAQSWTLTEFGYVLCQSCLLFVAGGLVLPSADAAQPESAFREYFNQDGRWALAALIGYDLITIPGNYLLWGQPGMTVTLILLGAAALCLLMALVRSRPIQVGITILQGIVAIAGVIFASVGQY